MISVRAKQMCSVQLSVVTGARLVWADDLVALTSTSDPHLPWEEQLSHLLGNSNLLC